MQYNYNYGDGGQLVDETSHNFKKMGEDRKAMKKEAVSKSPPFFICVIVSPFACSAQVMCTELFIFYHCRYEYAVQLQLWGWWSSR